MVRLVCLSDTHSKHKQVPIPDGDILIHAGDLTPRGNYYDFISVGKWFESLKERFKHRIFIAGNHDFGLESDRQLILKSHFDRDVIYLQDSGVELEGIKFWGSPWVNQFYNWAFMKEEDDLALHWEAISDDTQVLITHGPPFGILDTNKDEVDKETGIPDRCGSKTLLDRVMQLPNLKHHIFGHIHDHGGKDWQIGYKMFHNVAALNYMYRYQNAPTVIDVVP